MKYDPLRRKLESIREHNWTASFADIEHILGSRLPPSARNHRAWWSNSDAGVGVQSRSWLEAGWKVESVYALREVVTFVRMSSGFMARREIPVAVSRIQHSEAASVDPLCPMHAWDTGDAVDLRLGFAWHALGMVTIDASGKLKFPTAPASPGLYRFRIRSNLGEATYVGESDNIQRRFNGYRTPGPSQLTNIRICHRLTVDLLADAEVSVSIVTAGVWVELNGSRKPTNFASKVVRRACEHAALLVQATDYVESLNQ